MLNKEGLLKIKNMDADQLRGLYFSDKSQQVILAHRKDEINLFLHNIDPYIVPCMRYKLRDGGLYRGLKNA